eukprot:scaffold23104_cov56-Attheya_sp.AAC.4
MAKGKVPRDPHAPKRNVSAYLMYQNAMREPFKAQNPGMTFGQLSKYTSACYAELTAAEKQLWVERAEADKARYMHELSHYVPPPGYDARGDAVPTFSTTKTGRRSKPERDPHAPKRSVSAYLSYQNAMRQEFKNENPGMSFGQLAKYTSHMYKSLTPEEKAVWEERAAHDKMRYDVEIASYIPPPGHDAKGNVIEEYRPLKKTKRPPKDPAAPKRARGSFVFFTFEQRPRVMAEFPSIKFVEMGTVLGDRWRALTPEQKGHFEMLAAQDKIRFQKEMEQYKLMNSHLNPQLGLLM